MSKSTQTSNASANPFLAMDPKAMIEAQREATLGALEGMLGFQSELQKATTKGLERMQKEASSWIALSHETTAEGMNTAFDLSSRALTAWKDEVARFGKAAQA